MKNQAACRLHALLTELIAGGLASEMTVTKANLLLEEVDVTDQVTRQRVVIATELVDDITRLETQMRTSKQRIRLGVAASGTSLIEITGIGPIGAAIILGSVADIARFPTAGHFASYNAPLPSRRRRETRPATDLTREGTANSTMPSTSLPSPNSATPARAASTTRRRSPRARLPKKRSGR